MTTRKPSVILAANWNSSNVTQPNFISEPKYSKNVCKRCLSERRVKKDEDYMGIFSRTNYTPESHDLWLMTIVGATEDDVIDIADEVRRICATFSPTTTEKILNWQGGDWKMSQPSRWEFEFLILVKKSGIGFG